MRRIDILGLVLFLVLGAACAVLGARIARHYQTGGRLSAELGREALTTLEPETRERLQALQTRVSATYYVSSRVNMPSHMRRTERQVTDLLQAMRAAAPEHFDFQIVDPEERGELARFAANRRIAPFRERSVTRDSYSERTIWSALALSHGTRPEAVINGITPEKLPRLQRTIVAHLDQIEAPREPVFCVVAPEEGFHGLRDALDGYGRVIEVPWAAFQSGAAFPHQADVLFWLAPSEVDSRQLAALDRFLAAGRSVVLAGAALELDGPLQIGAQGPELRLRGSGFPAGALWSHFGLRPLSGLYGDERADEVVVAERAYLAPFVIRSIAPNHNFRRWSSQPNGTLLFALATPFALDGPELARKGWNATALATSSDATWRMDPPLERPMALAAMTRERGIDVPKQALMVELAADDPWHGRVIALGATTPFEDALFDREHNAHRALLRTLVHELASDQRLVVADAPPTRPDPLPVLSAAERSLWRALVVFLIPAVLFAAFFRGRERGRERGRGQPGPPAAARWRPVLMIGAGTLLALAAAAWLPSRALAIDVSAEQASVLGDEVRALAARMGRTGAVDVTLAFSPRSSLPPSWRPELDRVESRLKDLERAGLSIQLERIDPQELEAQGSRATLAGQGARLAALGVRPYEVLSRDETTTTVRTVFASVLFERDGRKELVSFPEQRAFEDLDFRLAFALWRLETGRAPHVAFASDVPRLSAAEAHELYQQKGLFAPSGVDVYSRARELLVQSGYRVTHVNPRDPVLPEDTDVLVWMQPRRSIEPMLKETARFLHGGGAVLLAAQHFNIQSRQYKGAEFELVYWPQPQSADVEQLWFPELGIELVREVLFDELTTAIQTDTQITGRDATQDFERQTSALPFLVRAAAANFDDESPVTRYLGDQALPWPSFLRVDEERLAEIGLCARTLISTSPRSWSYGWKGGWIPPEVLEGARASGPDGASASSEADPARSDASEAPPVASAWLGRVPLAIWFEGSFPLPVGPLRLNAGEERDAVDDELDWPEPAPGKLLFVGSSELFKDHRIDDEDFRADHLLANAVASLCLEPELVEAAVRRRVPRGFDYLAPDARLAWRAAVVGAGPLALCALALVWGLVRRRATAPPERPPERTGDRGA